MGLEKILLGTVQLGLDYGINNKTGKPTTETAFKILDTCYRNGIKYLDTAEAYGTAQQLIGNYHSTSHNRFEVITKLGISRLKDTENLEQHIDEDISTLNVSHLYGYLFHNMGLFRKNFDKPILQILKDDGKVKKIGVSVYTNEEAEELCENDLVDIVQLPFNLLDNMNQRGRILEKLKENGKEIHVRSVFLQGLFFIKPGELPEKLAPLKSYIEKIHSIAEDSELTVSQLALSYVLQNRLIDKVIIGVESQEQLNEHITFLKNGSVFRETGKIDSIAVREKELLNPTNWLNEN